MGPRRSASILLTIVVGVVLAACGTQAAIPAAPSAIPPAASATSSASSQADLSGVKSYLLGKTSDLQNATAQLKRSSDRYYELAQAANFDYASLWKSQPKDVLQAIEQARAGWVAASPLYEQMEGIVGGVPSLSQYDVDLDAGASGAEGGESVVSFDITLPDGTVLPKPGNLFGVTESTLWGTFADYTAKNAPADFNANGTIEFAEALPDANVLKGSVDLLAAKAAELAKSATTWQPTEADAFTALAVMVPTMTEYFNSWKNSRFVAGETSSQRDFVAISRLADIQDILGSLQVVHEGVSPLIKVADPTQEQQIGQGLNNLKTFIAGVHTKEQSGQRFSAEEAEMLGAEAQNRATAITGQITQVAAKLNIKIEQ